MIKMPSLVTSRNGISYQIRRGQLVWQWLTVFGVAGCLACAGCTSIYHKLEVKRVDWNKTQSVTAAGPVRIKGQSPERYFASRMAELYASDDPELFRKVRHSEPSNPQQQKQPPQEQWFGQAVPVTSDGYYLTAAHCVEKEQLGNSKESAGLVLVYGEGRLRLRQGAPVVAVEGYISKARVVKRFSGAGIDLAVIHVRCAKRSRWFSLDQKTAVRAGDSILSYTSNPEAAASLGRVLRVEGGEILSNVPIRPGDSGGPVIDQAGNLVGINTAMGLYGTTDTQRLARMWLFGLAPYINSEHVHLDRGLIKKIRRVIEFDRSTQR